MSICKSNESFSASYSAGIIDPIKMKTNHNCQIVTIYGFPDINQPARGLLENNKVLYGLLVLIINGSAPSRFTSEALSPPSKSSNGVVLLPVLPRRRITDPWSVVGYTLFSEDFPAKTLNPQIGNGDFDSIRSDCRCRRLLRVVAVAI